MRESLQTARALVQDLLQDPLLSDLSQDVRIHEVEACIASELGTSITLHIKRLDGETFDVVLPQAADVKMLMSTIQRAIERTACRRIHWRYTWERYCLVHVKGSQRTRLLDESKHLEDYGIQSGDQVVWARNLLSRDVASGRRHVRAKKRGRKQ
eukprot:CAMPEP_0118922494 /NCGR_PEP_ID=MMETSP1169-20130426/1406_1 /TAXON_ID=36882 /ORGANISM="Pyramimonas obovata, Strain CCMP722" /LENGTH=153 /DNA_ID=CAMNT_0006863377 /DNA_START=168 /DNA_END=629 /DNA_ORIENTATION=+